MNQMSEVTCRENKSDCMKSFPVKTNIWWDHLHLLVQKPSEAPAKHTLPRRWNKLCFFSSTVNSMDNSLKFVHLWNYSVTQNSCLFVVFHISHSCQWTLWCVWQRGLLIGRGTLILWQRKTQGVVGSNWFLVFLISLVVSPAFNARAIFPATPPLVVQDRVSLCSPDCPGTHYVDRAGLKLTEICLPLPPKW